MTVTQQGETKRTTIYFPKHLWRALRQAALDTDTSLNQLCNDAVLAHLAKMGDGKRPSRRSTD